MTLRVECWRFEIAQKSTAGFIGRHLVINEDVGTGGEKTFMRVGGACHFYFFIHLLQKEMTVDPCVFFKMCHF